MIKVLREKRTRKDAEECWAAYKSRDARAESIEFPGEAELFAQFGMENPVGMGLAANFGAELHPR